MKQRKQKILIKQMSTIFFERKDLKNSLARPCPIREKVTFVVHIDHFELWFEAPAFFKIFSF